MTYATVLLQNTKVLYILYDIFYKGDGSMHYRGAKMHNDIAFNGYY